jgi:hypothetical protein
MRNESRTGPTVSVQNAAVIRELRDLLLEVLYGEEKYSAWGHTLAEAIYRADQTVGDRHYHDVRKRYPGPRGVARRVAA